MSHVEDVNSLSAFLKKTSPIPNSFIDDMFAFYRPSSAQTDFVVDLDAVAKWLQVKKFTLMATLKSSYTNGVDYVMERKPSPNVIGRYGRNAYKQVRMSPDCFKRLCMRSKGRTAENVRTYFIQVEALVSKYQEQLLESMRADLARVESASQARRLPRADGPPRTGYIYVLAASDASDSVVKIGRTKDLARRLREHSAARADAPQVMYTFETDDAHAVETCLKGWLRDRRWARGRYKEVYRADADMVKQLIHGCDALGRVKASGMAPRRPRPQAGGDANLFIAVVRQ